MYVNFYEAWTSAYCSKKVTELFSFSIFSAMHQWPSTSWKCQRTIRWNYFQSCIRDHLHSKSTEYLSIMRWNSFQPCLTDHLDIRNVKQPSNHRMALAMDSQGSCSWTSTRKLSSSWYLSVTSNPHTWCSLRRQTGHRNSGWDIASPTELLSFMAQWKYSQWLSPNKWHTSWLTTWKVCCNCDQIIKNNIL